MFLGFLVVSRGQCWLQELVNFIQMQHLQLLWKNSSWYFLNGQFNYLTLLCFILHVYLMIYEILIDFG